MSNDVVNCEMLLPKLSKMIAFLMAASSIFAIMYGLTAFFIWQFAPNQHNIGFTLLRTTATVCCALALLWWQCWRNLNQLFSISPTNSYPHDLTDIVLQSIKFSNYLHKGITCLIILEITAFVVRYPASWTATLLVGAFCCYAPVVIITRTLGLKRLCQSLLTLAK